MKSAGRIDAKAQENESRRIALEGRLKEKVVEAKEDTKAHDRARNARFAATGEGQCEKVIGNE
jgi:hypothetical protein